MAIGEAVERIDVDLNRVNFARGEIGSRLQTLDVGRNAARGRKRPAQVGALERNRRRPGRGNFQPDGPAIRAAGLAADGGEHSQSVDSGLHLARGFDPC